MSSTSEALTVADIQRAKSWLKANDTGEPRIMPFTRPEARILFGAEAIEGVPDNQVVRICGEHVYLVGEKWPLVPLQLTK